LRTIGKSFSDLKLKQTHKPTNWQSPH